MVSVRGGSRARLLRQALESHGQRYTRQRSAVYRYLAGPRRISRWRDTAWSWWGAARPAVEGGNAQAAGRRP